jgi:nitrogen-specific signal transduction histidine kinase
MKKRFKKLKKRYVFVSDMIKMHKSMQEDLVQAVEKAETANRAKSEFLSRVSHEIRTPMNAIIGMTKLAMDSGDMQKIKDYLEKIDTASEHLLDIINDILDMSQIEEKSFELNTGEFDLRFMIDSINKLVSAKIKAKNIKFDIDMDKKIADAFGGDESRLMQVIMGLLSNAVKFTPSGGKITLSVKEISRGQGSALLEFKVTDTGIGISKEQQANLFKAFEQGDGSISRKYGGMGIELAICKKIVELMGGNIHAESEPGKGSTFIFTVRLETQGEAEPEKPAQPREPINMIEITQELLMPDIDLDEALGKLSGNKKLFVSLMKGFKGEDLYNQLIEAKARNDLSNAVKAAHTLVTLAANLSMPLLYINAMTAENHLKTEGFTEFKYYADKIKEALELLYEKINLIINNM